MPEEAAALRGTMAPLVVKDTVIAGVSGADQGIRGFIACYKAETGELIWRHWTVPRKGEPGSETWQGSEPLRGGGSTWLTGSYDEAADTLVLADGQSFPGWRRSGPGWRQSVHELHPGVESTYGRAEMALPVHAARRE